MANEKFESILEASFFGKRVLVTGHTGFKGSWLTQWLVDLGAEVTGFSIGIPTSPSIFSSLGLETSIKDLRGDVSGKNAFAELIKDVRPDYIFHLAAQSLVPKSYDDPFLTWQTNVMGTLSLLESLRYYEDRCNVVVVTSDKCYENVEWEWGYRETDQLGGKDPYSASKAAAELLVHSFIHSFFKANLTNVRIATARAGNVIGGGDWSENRIVPDCVRAWTDNKIVKIRNQNSTRPWQHVLEPLSGYLALASAMSSDVKFHGESFNFGPDSKSVHTVTDLVEGLASSWENPKWTAVNDSSMNEANLLQLNCDKAHSKLNWFPTLDFVNTLSFTSSWYRTFENSPAGIKKYTSQQISQYCARAKLNGLQWAQ